MNKELNSNLNENDSIKPKTQFISWMEYLEGDWVESDITSGRIEIIQRERYSS